MNVEDRKNVVKKYKTLLLSKVYLESILKSHRRHRRMKYCEPMHTKVPIPLTVARSTLMVDPKVDLTRLSDAECNSEAAYYSRSRSPLEIRSPGIVKLQSV